MFRRFYFVLTALLAVGTMFVACSKQVEPVAATQNQTEAPAKAEPACTSVSDGQIILDAFIEVISAVADASAKETCAEVVKALKTLDNDATRTKVSRIDILETCPENVQEDLMEANLSRLFEANSRMNGFEKCEESPQAEEIVSLISAILMLEDDDDDDDDVTEALSVDIPPEVQAAMETLIEVLSAVAEAIEKETCEEVVEAFKHLVNDDIHPNKVRLARLLLDTYPEDVQQAAQLANFEHFFEIALRISNLEKCKETPQSDEIDRLLKAIVAPDEK